MAEMEDSGTYRVSNKPKILKEGILLKTNITVAVDLNISFIFNLYSIVSTIDFHSYKYNKS